VVFCFVSSKTFGYAVSDFYLEFSRTISFVLSEGRTFIFFRVTMVVTAITGERLSIYMKSRVGLKGMM
jgi:hypothetical protein